MLCQKKKEKKKRNVVPLASGLYGFWWEIVIQIIVPLSVTPHLSGPAFKNFSYDHHFSVCRHLWESVGLFF